MSHQVDRNRSFVEQLGDALSPDPTRRAATGDTLADEISQSLANNLAGNHPSLLERGFYGKGSASSKFAQSMFDDAFGNESEES
jgi:hypothetical protein